jgi:hypothetical protein
MPMGMMMPAGNAIGSVLPRDGRALDNPANAGGGIPPEVKQDIMGLLAAIQRDPDNAMQYIQIAKERYGVDLQQIAQGM